MKKEFLGLITIIFCHLFLHAQVVTIGNQHWMTKNLDVVAFRNGDLIREARTNREWEQAIKNKQPAWCYYENNPKNGAKYGKIYNWYAVCDPRGLAPRFWHIPSFAEWNKLQVHSWHKGNTYITLDEAIDAYTTPISEEEYDMQHYEKGLSQKSINKLGKLQGGYRVGNGWFGNIGSGGCYWWTSTMGYEVGFEAQCSLRKDFSFENGRRITRKVRTIGASPTIVDKGQGLYVLCINDRLENQIPTDNF